MQNLGWINSFHFNVKQCYPKILIDTDERKHSRSYHWQCREFKNQLERTSTFLFELFEEKNYNKQVEGANPL
jgi:hypothetical protein